MERLRILRNFGGGGGPGPAPTFDYYFIINIIIFIIIFFFFRNAAEMKALEQCAVFAVVQQFIDKDKLKFEH